jgi:hypothetical protein
LSLVARDLRAFRLRLVSDAGDSLVVVREAVSAIAAKRAARLEFPELRVVSAILA